MNLYEDLPAAKGEAPNARVLVDRRSGGSVGATQAEPVPPAAPVQTKTVFVPAALAAKRKLPQNTASSTIHDVPQSKRARVDGVTSTNEFASSSGSIQVAQAANSASQSTELSLAALHVFPTHIDDEYDPGKPNDYETVLSHREFEAAALRRAQELAEEMREMQQQREAAMASVLQEVGSSENAEVNASAIAVAMAARSSRGFDLMPAWMKAKLQQQQQQQQQQQPQSSHTVDAVSEVQEESTSATAAGKIMQRWGYQEGKGLGKHETGITAPLQHVATGVGTGVVKGRAIDTHKDTSFATSLHQSRVILIKNMVGPGEVDAELEAEVKHECQTKYGPVDSVLIYECDTSSGIRPEEAVRIFVAFKSYIDARTAIDGLHARYFAGRQISVCPFDEQRFKKYDLGPSTSDY